MITARILGIPAVNSVIGFQGPQQWIVDDQADVRIQRFNQSGSDNAKIKKTVIDNTTAVVTTNIGIIFAILNVISFGNDDLICLISILK